MAGLVSISGNRQISPRGRLVVGNVLEFYLKRTERGATLTFLNILFPQKVSLFWDHPCLSVGFCLWASAFFDLHSSPSPLQRSLKAHSPSLTYTGEGHWGRQSDKVQMESFRVGTKREQQACPLGPRDFAAARQTYIGYNGQRAESKTIAGLRIHE